ncbi:MAG: 30S ribosomal protein S20 [Gemmatales bacterium]|nr:MAG: 30S ribosomal protein S20 [Gemmatales bacterium]
MPHTRSAKKRLRQNVKRRLYNRSNKRAIKTQIKKVLAALETGEAEQVQKEFRLAVKKLDKAAARRILHPNTAARKKSKLARVINRKLAAKKEEG